MVCIPCLFAPICLLIWLRFIYRILSTFIRGQLTNNNSDNLIENSEVKSNIRSDSSARVSIREENEEDEVDIITSESDKSSLNEDASEVSMSSIASEKDENQINLENMKLSPNQLQEKDKQLILEEKSSNDPSDKLLLEQKHGKGEIQQKRMGDKNFSRKQGTEITKKPSKTINLRKTSSLLLVDECRKEVEKFEEPLIEKKLMKAILSTESATS